ncbi:M48 family metallopeptidase [Sulfuriflexus mobilis]|uniref:M48 family metallopeptidase n=1 Tax=Sulfuriflexus mobilis TaxID=1811807 RepID=UPI001559639F|nr:SprT family zinc-dependent metalloprotease [Sulfuriflexus mobilis]
MRLKVSAPQGLVVVVPRGFDTGQIPALLATQRPWLEKVLAEFAERMPDDADEGLPEQLSLRAIGQTWSVEYAHSTATHVSARSHTGQRVRVRGNITDKKACRAALRRWLLRQAHIELVPWLEALSHTHSLPYKKTRVSMQKTRWGSCSSRGTISINAQLLFLERHHVEYVFLHELCHTVQMNHSPQFWAMLAARMPGYRDTHQAIRQAWQYTPAWTSDKD